MTDTPSTAFETETCGRCGGCGRYSYNQIDGDRCYGCHGTGKRMTKRGAIARQWFRTQKEVAIEDLKVGDRVNVRGYGKFKVVEIETKDRGDKHLKDGVMVSSGPSTSIRSAPLPNGKGSLGFTAHAGYKVERWLLAEENNALLRKAFALQDTLTKAGTVRKRSTT